MRNGKAATGYRLFKVETSFETKTRQPGGIGRSDAVAAAEQSIRAMQASIEETLNGKLEQIESIISSGGMENGHSSEQIHSMLALAIILRDLGGVVGFNLVTYVSESLCKVLQLFESRGGFDMAVVDCHLKTIRIVRGENYRNLQIGDLPQLKAGFDDMFRKTAAQYSY